MRRMLFAMALLIGFSTVATAGPLPWTYIATLAPTPGNTGILLGQETVGDQTVYVTLNLPSSVSESLAFDSYQEPFAFSLGNVITTTTLPAGPLSNQQFNYSLQLQNQNGETGTVSLLGSISATSMQTSGTGNFTLGFSGSQDVQVGQEVARVTFGTRSSESAERLTFNVEVLPSVNAVPEPGTLMLAGAACFAWVVGRQRRRITPGWPS